MYFLKSYVHWIHRLSKSKLSTNWESKKSTPLNLFAIYQLTHLTVTLSAQGITDSRLLRSCRITLAGCTAFPAKVFEPLEALGTIPGSHTTLTGTLACHSITVQVKGTHRVTFTHLTNRKLKNSIIVKKITTTKREGRCKENGMVYGKHRMLCCLSAYISI